MALADDIADIRAELRDMREDHRGAYRLHDGGGGGGGSGIILVDTYADLATTDADDETDMARVSSDSGDGYAGYMFCRNSDNSAWVQFYPATWVPWNGK